MEREYTEKEKEAIGHEIAKIFKLKRSVDHKDRYVMGGGYLTKTAVGVFNAIQSISQDIEKGQGFVRDALNSVNKKGMER